MSLKVRSWRCPECGVAHDRDVNAAVNLKQQGIMALKAEGLSVSAHGGLRQSSSEVAA
uniref:transposase n=1 Tax=Vreelandella venusta TaxID=44935 RepID=UPI001E323D4F|nr:transposase [Halomonas hydrothermalis]